MPTAGQLWSVRESETWNEVWAVCWVNDEGTNDAYDISPGEILLVLSNGELAYKITRFENGMRLTRKALEVRVLFREKTYTLKHMTLKDWHEMLERVELDSDGKAFSS